jgi:multimeric flavodoxin WrbA
VPKVIGIAGSPRRGGNSTTLLKAVLAGAEEAGARGRVVTLNDLTFRGCQGCEPCAPDAACVVKDDLAPVLEALRTAEVWVLAAPIYFDGVSGQMKSFFDRCHRFATDAGKVAPQLPGKRAAAVIVTYEDKPRDDYRQAAQTLANYLKWMGDFEPIEVLSVGSLGPADAAGKRPELLAKARETGKMLIEQLSQRAASS